MLVPCFGPTISQYGILLNTINTNGNAIQYFTVLNGIPARRFYERSLFISGFWVRFL